MWYTLRKEEIIRKLETNEKTGLTQNQVEQKQKDIGKNVIIEGKSETIFTKFIKQFKDVMIIILIAASVISAIMSYVQGENNYIDSIIIIAIVIANALMGVIQESKAEKAIESLKQLTPPKAKVIRDGEIYTATGEIEGYIAEEPKGRNGIGFEPIFDARGGKTLAEMGTFEKNRISSLKKAIKKLQRYKVL